MADKILFVSWCPKDALDGMQLLDPWTELAYRRLIDLIYVHENKLPDDSDVLSWATKVGDRWPEIRDRLLTMKKIYVKDGLIRNEKCDEIFIKTRKKIAQRKAAGKASADARKSRENNNDLTVVGTDTATNNPTEPERQANNPLTTNHKPSSVTNVTAGDQNPEPPDKPKPVDPAKRTFDLGKEILTKHGVAKNAAGGLIKRWRDQIGDAALQGALTEADSRERHDIVAYLTKAIVNIADRTETGQERTPGHAPSLSMESLREKGLIF